MRALNDDIRAILERFWPHGMPADEQALLQALPSDRIALAARRLKAIGDVEDGRPVSEVVGDLGVDAPAFYRMRKRWRDNPSIRSVAPFTGRALRSLGTASSRPDPELVEALLRKAMLREGRLNYSATTLARELITRWGRPMSLDAAVRLVRSEHMRLTDDPSYLVPAFGTRLLVDVCAVSLAIRGTRDVTAAVVAVVMDDASRVIVAHGTGVVSSSLIAQMEAARRLDRLGAFEDAGGRHPQIQIVMGYGKPALAEAILNRACHAGISIASAGDRRCGARMLGMIGHRLGRLRLRPRATSPTSLSAASVSDLSHPPMREVHAFALIDEAVRDHNRGRLALITGDTDGASQSSDAIADYVKALTALAGRTDAVGMLVTGCRTIERIFDNYY